MLKLSEIKDLIKLIDQTSVNELEIENEGSRISIRKHKPETTVVQAAAAVPAYAPSAAVPAVPAVGQAPASPPAPSAESAQAPAEDKSLHKIVSPMVGTFYRASSPGAAPFVNPGDRVSEKTVVCIVEAMKLMNEIEAEIKGEIVEVLVENGQLVEYGQPLFLVRT